MSAIAYRRLRAPERHGAALVAPPAEEAPTLVAANRERLAAADFLCGGRSANDLRHALRRETIQAAGEYVRAYAPERTVPDCDTAAPLLVAGHQPQLFHAGVWFKNFLLAALAGQTGGVALNLIIDNDLVRETGIRVPGGSCTQPRLDTVAYDRTLADMPWEDRALEDADLFRSFAERVQQAAAGVVRDPLVAELWPDCLRAVERHGNVGRALAAGRHLLEQRWGLATWELPLSRLCETEAFRRFLVHLFEHLPEFLECYNGALDEYRRVHGIRNGAHPAPNLAAREGRLETPLWIWSHAAPRRTPLFVEWSRSRVTIPGTQPRALPLGSRTNCEHAVEQLAAASRAGWRLRPRALLTTLFTRLFLADVFVHGIGGAKYDQVTDVLLEKFFGVEPPRFITATATVRLPGAPASSGEAELRRVEQALRNLTYHPETFLEPLSAGPAAVQKALEEKRFWLAQALPRGARRARQQGIVAANAALAQYAAPVRVRLAAERDRLEQQLPSQRILNSREYSFCLFPESFLRGLLLDISRARR